jgi:hypothetical protein
MQLLVRRSRGYISAAAMLVAALALAAGLSGTSVWAASWHLDSSFGKQGVAGLPVREGGYQDFYAPGPGDQGSLLALGPQGSVFIGGYAHSKPGALLVARMSAQGKLVRSFGHGGLTTVPAIYSLPEHPPRLFALSGGLLIVGLNRAHQLVAVRLSARGRPDNAFGRDGVAQYTLANTHGHAIVAAAAVESSGDILIAYFRSEVPQPVNQPMITHGLGVGPLGLVRLLPSGGLDPSFGHAGFLTTTGPQPATGELVACGVTIAPEGSVFLAYEQAYDPNGSAGSAFPAVQELGTTGSDTPGFGADGVAYLSFTPVFEGVDSVVCGGLFALANGEVEASFGGGGELFRFTSAGAPDPAFGTSGHTSAGPRVLDLAVGSDRETFALDAVGTLTVAGTLSSGAPDPGLSGTRGKRFAARLPRPRPGEEQQVVELLPANAGLDILVGENLVRLEE